MLSDRKITGPTAADRKSATRKSLDRDHGATRFARTQDSLPRNFRSARCRTISRPSRRCSARSSSITRRSIEFPISSKPRHFFEKINQDIYRACRPAHPRQQVGNAGHAENFPARRAGHRRACRSTNIWRGLPPKRPRSSTPRITAAPSTTFRFAAHLIEIGDAIVNLAYDAPVECDARRAISKTPNASSTRLPRPGATTAAFCISQRH